MEFQSTTSGDTTLVLDAPEETWLRAVAQNLGLEYSDALAQFESLRFNNPLASFEELAAMFSQRHAAARRAGLSNTSDGPSDTLGDLRALDRTINRAMRSASSIQVEALLLSVKAMML